MVTITADQIISILQTGNYPSTIQLHYFKYKQKFPLYTASVEIIRAQPDSYTEDVIKTERNFQFEIRVLYRYLLQPDQDSTLQSQVEDEMTRVLKLYDFQGQGKIFLETIGWSRSDLGDPVYGNMSSVRIGVKDITSTDGNGYVGAYYTLELNSDTSPVQIQVLAKSFKMGRGIAIHGDDNGLLVGDPTTFTLGDFSITYETTAALSSLIQTLSQTGATVKGRLINGTTINKYIFQIGETVSSVVYADVEKSTTRVYANGTWT